MKRIYTNAYNLITIDFARSLLHFCDLRLPKDAQPEIRNLAELIFVEFEKWMPEVAAIYSKKRMGKNLLAP